MSSLRSTTGHGREAGASTDERFGLLISIQPRFANAILQGTKTVELRRKPPRDQPDVVIIYGSGTARAVLGVAQLSEVHTSTPGDIWERFGATAGIARAEFDEYFEGSETASALELTHPRRSGDEVPLSQLRQFGLEPPQSWRYVERQTAIRLLDALGLPSAERRVHSRRSLSWALTLPTALVDMELVEATTRLNRPLVRIIESVRCAGLAGFGARSGAMRGRRRSAL
ncbi:ASCH domain-containing protein [Marmoricola sp. Leaf446]|uniref:ASCH domain-containing protein n=1 Tax=Marmoricola sp. Leaf446 TaxID=1736379 RepID=UPI0012E396B9|nr:ASCH domain-containing protein [Marmoricola sp. Leaf446]